MLLAVFKVARFTRAWIETFTAVNNANINTVARFTRAWIETLFKRVKKIIQMSHASRVRGLKQTV